MIVLHVLKTHSRIQALLHTVTDLNLQTYICLSCFQGDSFRLPKLLFDSYMRVSMSSLSASPAVSLSTIYWVLMLTVLYHYFTSHEYIMLSSIFTILDTLLRGRVDFPSEVGTMSSISRFVIPCLHCLEPSCGSTVIWQIMCVCVSASAFSNAHKCMLIYEHVCKYGAMHVWVCSCPLPLIVHVKKMHMLFLKSERGN